MSDNKSRTVLRDDNELILFIKSGNIVYQLLEKNGQGGVFIVCLDVRIEYVPGIAEVCGFTRTPIIKELYLLSAYGLSRVFSTFASIRIKNSYYYIENNLKIKDEEEEEEEDSTEEEEEEEE